MDTPLEECRIPAVVIHKYIALDLDERRQFENKVVDAINAKEKERLKLKQATRHETSADYDKGFGGTEADSKNEKEAAALLRGDTGADGADGDGNPLLRPPLIDGMWQHRWLKQVGKWKKFDGADCTMYINVLSRDIGNRPSDYEDEVEVVLFLESDELMYCANVPYGENRTLERRRQKRKYTRLWGSRFVTWMSCPLRLISW